MCDVCQRLAAAAAAAVSELPYFDIQSLAAPAVLTTLPHVKSTMMPSARLRYSGAMS